MPGVELSLKGKMSVGKEGLDNWVGEILGYRKEHNKEEWQGTLITGARCREFLKHKVSAVFKSTGKVRAIIQFALLCPTQVWSQAFLIVPWVPWEVISECRHRSNPWYSQIWLKINQIIKQNETKNNPQNQNQSLWRQVAHSSFPKLNFSETGTLCRERKTFRHLLICCSFICPPLAFLLLLELYVPHSLTLGIYYPEFQTGRPLKVVRKAKKGERMRQGG